MHCYAQALLHRTKDREMGIERLLLAVGAVGVVCVVNVVYPLLNGNWSCPSGSHPDPTQHEH